MESYECAAQRLLLFIPTSYVSLSVHGVETFCVLFVRFLNNVRQEIIHLWDFKKHFSSLQAA